jgi:hypothetical protein
MDGAQWFGDLHGMFSGSVTKFGGACSQWLGLCVALVAALGVQAEKFSTDLDPICRLPRLSLKEADPESLYELLATDDPENGLWEPVLHVTGAHDHSWYDPQVRAQQRRFYRTQRMHPRPPALPIWNFRLTDHAGKAHELLREGDLRAVVLVFTDNANLAAVWNELRPVQEKFAGKPVGFWLVNPVDARPSLGAAVASAGVPVPVLHDAAQAVMSTFGIRRAGETVVVTSELMEEIYRGAVASRFQAGDGQVKQEFVEEALSAYLANQPVRMPMTRAAGAELAMAATGVPDYASEVAPLLQRSCVNCHRPGDIGSFAMTNHAVVARQAASIKANLLEGLMPPWHADAPKGVFTNDFSLQPAEVARLLRWVDAGAPKGAQGDPLADVVPPTPVDWPMGTPDRIVRITRQNIPAKSSQAEIPYKYAVVASPFTTNVWLRAAVVRPGNRQVVHHALIFTGTSFADVLQVQAGLGGFFAGYVPGMEQREYPAGTGKLLKRGSFIVFQMHYTPVETAQTDATEIGLYLMPQAPQRELVTGAAFTTDLSIPPGAADAPAAAEMAFARPVTIYELSPHMHYRGKRVRFEALLPDGTTDTLLNVPAYDFAWQAMYRFTEPRTYPAGTRIRVTGAFDNSVWNPFNPNPAATVGFGEQTDDEMFIGYLNYSEH